MLEEDCTQQLKDFFFLRAREREVKIMNESSFLAALYSGLLNECVEAEDASGHSRDDPHTHTQTKSYWEPKEFLTVQHSTVELYSVSE